LLLLLVLGFFGRLLLRSGAANAAVLLIPIVTLATSLGYHPVLVGVLFSMILAGIFIYQHTYGLIAYDYGAFEESDFIKASLVRYAAVALSIVLSYFIWWPLVGVI
jgi:di/tricarboxylate transporter